VTERHRGSKPAHQASRRSERRSTWPRRRSRTMSRPSSPSWRSLAEPRQRRIWPGARRHREPS